MTDTPLCVDLDGTLIATDLFGETFCALIAKKPLYLFIVPFWLLRGRAFCKKKIAEIVLPDFTTLPYIDQVVNFVKAEKESGRQTILVTASDRSLADGVQKHLNIFTEVIASDGVTNVRGKAKRNVLNQRFGEKKYDYIGNSTVDIPVWKGTRAALVVSRGDSFAERIKKIVNVEKVFTLPACTFKDIVKLIRAHQWVKNILVFAPAVMGHRYLFGEGFIWISGFIAFISISLIASSVYIVNDLADLQNDRLHPTKKLRAIASGRVPIVIPFTIAPVFFLLGLATAWSLGEQFLLTVILYYLITTAYTFFLKKVALLDTVILASLYTIRIIAGGAATGVYVSEWFLVFSMFLFLSLAAAKRYTELKGLADRNINSVPGRGYSQNDLAPVGIIGITTGIMSVLVLALYVNSSDVVRLYHRPELLLLSCPLLFYWVCRLWLICYRGKLEDDPTIFAITDRTSYIIGGLLFFVMLLAR